MNSYFILTNRKRAIIALIHSVAFLFIAAMGFTGSPWKPIWMQARLTAPLAILAIYVIVSSILWVLTRFSRCPLERFYFAFCSLSASVGVFRSLLGDPPLHLAIVLRVLLLSCAVVTGLVILKEHSEPEVAD